MKRVVFIALLSICMCANQAFAQDNQSAFVIGSNMANINGATEHMDVAPFITDNRTFLPIRYVAHAMGITDDNIYWDAENQTVTLIKEDAVVQFQLGSKTRTINSLPTIMDVAPLVRNQRVYLPVAHMASAFGATAIWDGSNTVTIRMPEILPTKQFIKYPDGKVFCGMVLNGNPQGHGYWIFTDGSIIEGDYNGASQKGHVRIWYKDGAVYEGDALDGVPEGQGVLYFSNEYTYVGYFRKGDFHGMGAIYDQYDNLLQHGNFDRGTYMGGQFYGMPDEWEMDPPPNPTSEIMQSIANTI